MELLADPVDNALIRRDYARLPKTAKLIERGGFTVVQAESYQIPNLLQEIGRLRELTFRQVGEGTGKPLDLDHFDGHYTHLILWDNTEQRPVGAYRLCRVGQTLKKKGLSGLYTSTLFKFDRKLLKKISPAIELGRSFIRPEYQRHYSALMLLWKGIGRYILDNPHIRYMFGPVSIDDNYHPLSRRMMIEFLTEKFRDNRLSGLVKPRKGANLKDISGCDASLLASTASDLDSLSKLVGELENDRAGVPVMLRQYIKLGALVLAFNVDREFSDCLDGLMLIDLPSADYNILSRYLGPEEAAGYLNCHTNMADDAIMPKTEIRSQNQSLH